MKRVIVIGAGASGLMAAYAAAARGNDVLVLERNEKAGKKIYITGKGRCNVTNAVAAEDFFPNVVHNPRFLKSCIHQFPPERMMRFLEEGGLHLKTERGNRVFPASDKASDVTKCLERYCKNAGVAFAFCERVLKIDVLQSTMFRITTDKRALEAEAVIVCTGGISYPATGSTGDGYAFARGLGLRVGPLRPALCGIECPGCEPLQGLSLKNVALTASRRDGRRIASFFGEMLFTHFGVSGPIVLSMSSLLNEADLADVRLSIDLKPALDDATLDKRLLREFDRYKNRQIAHVLEELLPKRMIASVLEQADIPPVLPVHSVSKGQRAALLRALKGYALTPRSLRPVEESIVTAGGIDVKEIDPKTMQSKKYEGLAFCGELLDVDAFTGGFNLQIAFATGFAAGNAI